MFVKVVDLELRTRLRFHERATAQIDEIGRTSNPGISTKSPRIFARNSTTDVFTYLVLLPWYG